MDDFRSKAGKKAAIVAIVANCFLTALACSKWMILEAKQVKKQL